MILQTGCTRIVLSVANIDPDTVKLEPLPRVHKGHFQPLIDKIEPRAGQLWSKAIYIVPSTKEVEVFVKNNPSIAEIVVAYKDHIEGTLGSTRTTEEIESLVIPSMTHNTDVSWAAYVPSVIKKRNIFNELQVKRKNIAGDVDMQIGNLSPDEKSFVEKVLLIAPDLSDPMKPLVSISLNGQTVTLDANKIWPKNPNMSATQELGSATKFLEWIEQSIKSLN